MKKQMLKGLVALLVLAFMAVPALAKVSLAPNDKGDLLIYPVYAATNGIETTFTVINTSDTQCAVAKVVVRSMMYSVEVLDFLIYLTPNDVFKGILKVNENGKAVLVSYDDSLLTSFQGGVDGIQQRGDQEGGIEFTLLHPFLACPAPDAILENDLVEIGYIEVFEAAAFDLDVRGDCAKGSNGTVAKDDLFAYYWAATSFETDNILTGSAELIIPGGDYALFKPTIFRDYHQDEQLDVGEETVLGNGADPLCVLEAVLSKDNLAVPYYTGSKGATTAILTFPTKLMNCEVVPDGNFFDQNSVDIALDDYAIEYTDDLYDMEELRKGKGGCTQSPCPGDITKYLPWEVNFIAPWNNPDDGSIPYLEGWTRLSFDEDTHCAMVDFEGAPVIGLILEVLADEEINGLVHLSLMPPAYDFGPVSCGEGTQVYGAYQLGFSDCD